MALWDICAYDEVAKHITGLPDLPDNGIYTGHHIIPDHCFYYTSGLRGKGELSAFLCPGVKNYTTNKGLVIIVDADGNGGKSRTHGQLHQVFDPEENRHKHPKHTWTYAQARAAAVASVLSVYAALSANILAATLDTYYKNVCGIADWTLLRAGEHGAMKGIVPARGSVRYKPY